MFYFDLKVGKIKPKICDVCSKIYMMPDNFVKDGGQELPGNLYSFYHNPLWQELCSLIGCQLLLHTG